MGVSLWQDIFEDEIDWWSKYYASTEDENDRAKCGDYLERGYDTLEVEFIIFYSFIKKNNIYILVVCISDIFFVFLLWYYILTLYQKKKKTQISMMI